MLVNKLRLPLSLLGVFVLIALFFLPLFQGKVLFQSDTQGWKGMVQEIKTFKEKTGEHSYWTGNLFSGMPTINVTSGSYSNWVSFVEKTYSWLPALAGFGRRYCLYVFLLLSHYHGSGTYYQNACNCLSRFCSRRSVA